MLPEISNDNILNGKTRALRKSDLLLCPFGSFIGRVNVGCSFSNVGKAEGTSVIVGKLLGGGTLAGAAVILAELLA